MKTKYECEGCGKQFVSQSKCADCEKSHLEDNEKVLYKIVMRQEDPCDYCEHSYFVYGCERDCQQKCKTYDKFIPIVPLHNKRSYGGI